MRFARGQRGKPVTTTSDRSFRRIAAAIFALMAAANYLPVFSGKIPFPRDLVLRHAAWSGLPRSEPLQQFPEIGDLITSFYPYHRLAAQAWREGTVGLWNPTILAGAPLLANAQSALFYPFNFFYYILPVAAAWTVCLMLRMFLAAWFMGLLVRSIGGSTTGAIVSGIVFASCGFMTVWQGQAMGDAAVWLPLIGYGVIRLHRHRSCSSIALLGASFAMPILAGHPETAFHLMATGSALALFLWMSPTEGKRQSPTRPALHFALGVLLALGLASVQMIPSLEWVGQPGWSYDVATPALSWHDGQGFFSRDIQRNLNSAGIPVPEAAGYLGMFTLLAAPFAFFHSARRLAVFFAVVTIVSTAIAFSVEPAHWLVAHLPFIKVMKHGRLILLATFGLAAMAGLGISVLEQQAEMAVRRPAIAFVLLGGACVAAAVSIYKLHLATFVAVEMSKGPAASLTFLLAGAALFAWRIAGGLKEPQFRILLVGLAAFEMVTFSYGYTGFARMSDVFPSAPVFDFLRAQGDPATFRIAKAGYPISANAGTMYNLQAADGYEICLLRTRTFCRDLTLDRDDAVFFLPDRIAESHDRRIDLLNLKYFVVISPSPESEQFSNLPNRYTQVYKDDSVAVFENAKVSPRLFAVPQSGIEVIEPAAAQLARMKDPAFNPERMAVFAEQPAAIETQDAEGASQFNSDVRLIGSGMNESRFRVRTSEPTVLVLSQIYYSGWKASIDGAETPVQPVDYALSGILAPAGEHEIRFVFEPRNFKIGVMLSLSSLCALAGLVLVKRGQ